MVLEQVDGTGAIQTLHELLLWMQLWMDRVWVGFRRPADEFSSIFDMTGLTCYSSIIQADYWQ
jgi:hypothetical protein